MEDLHFRAQQSSRNDTGLDGVFSPRGNGPRILPQTSVNDGRNDARSNLARRFTTESGRMPTLASMPSLTSAVTSPPRVPDVVQDYNTLHKVQLIEKKKLEYERIREQKRHFELEMQKLEQHQRREAQELAQMEEEMSRFTGHQSEPTTPPEYRNANPNAGFPTIFSRPNRYSTPSLASPPPSLANRPGRSGSLLASPVNGLAQQRYGFEDNHQTPSRSVPPTRRNSDDDKEEAVRQDPTSHRITNARTNRYSMPVTHSRNGLNDLYLDQTNITRFLFGDDEPNVFSRFHAPDERFPTLVRRDDHGLSASSVALDLALSPSPGPDPRSSSNWRSSVNRHRTQQSMSAIHGIFPGPAGDSSGISGRPPASFRHSLDLKYTEAVGETPSNVSSPQVAVPPKLQSSFSANDIPTIKSSMGSSAINGNANNHAQQHFHNHNASIGRIPVGAVPNRHNRELSSDASMSAHREQANAFSSINSALQSNPAAFGSGAPAAASPSIASPTSTPSMNSFNSGFFPVNSYTPPASAGTNSPTAGQALSSGPYSAHMLSSAMQQMSMNSGSGGNAFSPQNHPGYGPPPFNQANQARDSQARVIQHRRQLDNEAMSRFQNMTLESCRGQIYELCKDQHGCRYLQKQLEERNSDQVHMIWLETNQHVIELMTDPFGNYLCQKLLEFCNDDERTVLIQNASQDMVRIALNQHGTRALQKMIEHVNTPQQIHLIIEALRFRVVKLIQDLNGNHVIQKCLNKLTAADAQFIFDAVGGNCVEVGTHRHGCCVLQRCIDHATGDQKLWLIQRITEHSRILVQDPFGNYVVQYIIDLNEPTFTEPIVGMFQGCISQLSRHKFSSNVIEKCLRCAQASSKDMIVEEMLAPNEMERLLWDSFANYVIQTALDFVSPHQKYRMVEAIRPILPQIRTTPYGRRIQAKIAAYDNRGSAASSGQVTPADNTQGQIPLRPAHARGISAGASILPATVAPTNGPLPSLASQAIRQHAPVYQNGAAVPGPPPAGIPGPAPQPLYHPMMPGGFHQGHTGNPNSMEAGEGRWV